MAFGIDTGGGGFQGSSSAGGNDTLQSRLSYAKTSGIQNSGDPFKRSVEPWMIGAAVAVVAVLLLRKGR